MSENPQNDQAQDAAGEAAQHIVDGVTSWDYSGEKKRIAEQLDEGLDEAGVEVPQADKERLVDEIDGLKDEESGGSPKVQSAEPGN
ncbi:MAG: hypothetical protein LWW86_04015 [Micrococcales bacterium]|nr:hypothetical protein [Micrococcales bacterium]